MRIVTLALFVFTFCTCFSQKTKNTELSEELKSKLIYCEVSDVTSNSQYQNSSTGQVKSGPASRKLVIRHKVGEESGFTTLDKSGDNLRKILKEDTKALAEFEKAFDARRQMKLCNALEIACLLVAVPLAMVFIVKLRKSKDDYAYLEEGEVKPKNSTVILAGVGAAGALGGMYYFYFKTNRLMDEYKDHVVNSIEMYNKNLIDAN